MPVRKMKTSRRDQIMIRKILKLTGFGLFIVAMNFVGIYVLELLLSLLHVPLTDSVVAACGTFGIFFASIGVALWCKKKGIGKEIGEERWKSGWRMLPVALTTVALIPVICGSTLGAAFHGILPMEPSVNPACSLTDYLLAIIVGPVSEELIFRKGIYGYTRKLFSRPAALVVSSLLFTLIHGSLSLQGFSQTLLVGVILVLIYEKTGNISYCIGTHMALNAFSVLSNVLVRSGIPFYTEPGGYVIYNIAVILLAAAEVAGSWLLLKKNPVRTELAA